jgi:hypothetical protein
MTPSEANGHQHGTADDPAGAVLAATGGLG